MKRFILVLAIASTCCAPIASLNGRSTAKLTTPGIVALHGIQCVKLLDVIRDTAVDAESNKLIETPTMLKIVKAHKAMLVTIRESPNGWKASVVTALGELKKDLTPSELNIVGAYIDGAKLVISTVA